MIQNQSTSRYVFQNGMKNIVFLTGFARIIEDASGNKRYYVQQHNDVSRMLPVYPDKKGMVVRSFRDKEPLKVIGRVRGRLVTIDGQSHREAYIVPIGITASTILEMPSALSWGTGIPHRKTGQAEVDDFQPFDASERDGRLQDAANNVEIAGIVNAISAIRSDEHGGQISGVEIDIRQHEDLASVIPVRMMNSGVASIMLKQLRMGSPVLITGKYRVRDLKSVSEDGVVTDSGLRTGYIWCRNIHNARRDVDIKTIPHWVKTILERYGKSDPALAAAVAPKPDQEEAYAPEETGVSEDELLAAIGVI